jgi:hypothetical protein
VPAAGQIRDDYAKALFQCRDLESPGRATASETVDEDQRLALTALQIVQRKIFVAKKRHGRRLLVLFRTGGFTLLLHSRVLDPRVAELAVIVSLIVL